MLNSIPISSESFTVRNQGRRSLSLKFRYSAQRRKTIKIPTLSVSGYKDHTRASLGFPQGTYENNYETKTLDHDRSIEFVVDPMDFDETDTVVSLANIQSRFDRTQAIPEHDSYTFSKLYAEAVRVGATIKARQAHD